MSDPADKLRLPNKHTAPPGQWRYLVPQTGQQFSGSNLPELIEKLRAHYRANGYEFPYDIEDKIEDYICAGTPGYCEGSPKARPVKMGLAHTFHVVLQGSKTLLSWIASGKEYVNQEQANERAGACVPCPLNQEPEGCTSCNMSALHKMVEAIVGKRTTKYDSILRSCRVCSCLLRAKVHLPLKVIVDNMPAEQLEALPPHCWIVKEQTPTPPYAP